MNTTRPGLGGTLIKVGGSLFDLPDLAVRIRLLLGRLDRGGAALIAGGGTASDLVRDWDRLFALGEERAHRLALAAMSLKGRLLVEIFPEAEFAGDRAAIRTAWERGLVPIINTVAILDVEAAAAASDGAPPLPHLWSATSDSVAAWIAGRLGFSELVLAKSRSLQPPLTLRGLAAEGLVDAHLPEIARGIPRVSVVNLRGRDGRRQAVGG